MHKLLITKPAAVPISNLNMSIQVLASIIKAKETDKFIEFLDKACSLAGDEPFETLSSLKEMLGKASLTLNTKIQKAANEKAVADMKKSTEAAASSSSSVDQEDSAKSQSSQPVFRLENSQFLEPRGRFCATVNSSGILLEGKQSVFIPWKSVSHIARVPSHSTTKKEGEDLVAVKLESGVKFGGKDQKHLLWVLGNSPSFTNTSIKSEGIALESDTACEYIQLHWRRPIGTVNKSLFQTVNSQKVFLRCYHGIQEGGIYPLKCGIIFIKPLVFIPSNEIASVVAGRGGGAGNTRYIDLTIETTDDRVIEFTNIEREELPSLQAYVKGYLEVRARNEAAKKRKAEGEAVVASAALSLDDEDDDDDEDDEDFNPDEDDSAEEDDDDSGSDAGSDAGDAGETGAVSESEDDREEGSEAGKSYVGKSKKRKVEGK